MEKLVKDIKLKKYTLIVKVLQKYEEKLIAVSNEKVFETEEEFVKEFDSYIKKGYGVAEVLYSGAVGLQCVVFIHIENL